MAGYSGTPLPRKLGIKPGGRVGTRNAPADFERTLGPLPDGAALRAIAVGRSPGADRFDVIVCFAPTSQDLERDFAPAARRLSPAGGLWIAWPKKSSGVSTDVTEALVREVGLSLGLVDNKVCAIDEVWSGLRFVVRLADRPRSDRPSKPPRR
jgi:hypothetical protein